MYKIELIINSAIYDKKTKNQLLNFYYLVLQKSCLEKKITQESLTIIIHFQKLISIFYKEHLAKLIITSLLLASTLLIVRLIILKESKQKYGHPCKETNKRDKSQLYILQPQIRMSCLKPRFGYYTQAFDMHSYAFCGHSLCFYFIIRFSLLFFQLDFEGFLSFIK